MSAAAVERHNGQERVTPAREKANMFHFLASLYNQRPDKEFAIALKTFGTESVHEMVETEGVSEDVSGGFSAISNYIDGIQGRSAEEIEEDLAVDWTRLFRGVQPEYGPKPPYESVYLSRGKEDQSQMARILSGLMAEYRSENVILQEGKANRPDYIGLELGFLGFLSDKEAEARERDKNEEAAQYAERRDQFLRNHLGRWTVSFCEEAKKYAETDFYRGVIDITQGVMEEFSSPDNRNAGNKERSTGGSQ